MPDLPVPLTDTGFPDPFVGDAQAFKDAWFAHIGATISSDNLLFGQIGGSAPLTNIGLWLDTVGGGVLKYWKTADSAYVPVKVDIGNNTDTVTLLAATLTADRTATFPNKTGTVALTSDVFTPRATVVLTGTTPTIDWSVSNSFFINLTGNTTFASSNSQPGQEIMVAVAQPSSHTITFTGVLFPGGSADAVASGTTDLFIIRNTAGSLYGQQLADES